MAADLSSIAREIVFEIENDLCDRRGLRQEWDQLDKYIQKEIRAEWVRTTVAVMERAELS